MTQKAKNIISVLAVLIVVYGVVANAQGWWPFMSQESGDRSSELEKENEVCIQVITRARSPETGEERDFPTPCDVPEAWEILEPEVTQ